MPGYFGSEILQLLQRRADEGATWAYQTPGACNGGRMMSTDDPDRLGWDRVFDLVARDGAFGFRLIPTKKVDETRARLAQQGLRLDLWDVFTATAADATRAVEPILAKSLPAGLRRLELKAGPSAPSVQALQAFLLASEIVPFCGSMLVGETGPSTTVVLEDKDSGIVASAYAYLPHNRFSLHHRFAWGGLVAVSPAHRGKGLGILVNAMMVREAIERLQAENIYELVSATNMPSRRMVEACGLRLNPDFKSGSASRGATPYTR
jgi:GNAT superfamily N-acetyltransferase